MTDPGIDAVLALARQMEAEAWIRAFGDATPPPEIADLVAEIRHPMSELDRLRQWKAEALIVLAEWDAVWDAAGRPGLLGESKPAAVRRLFTNAPDERPR